MLLSEVCFRDQIQILLVEIEEEHFVCVLDNPHEKIETADQFRKTQTTQSVYLPLSVKHFNE